MNSSQLNLWEKIKRFDPDDPEAALSFTDRLARENNWSLEFATRAVLEYKKFMFLICIAPHPLSPSDEVDQVWHLHLLYTESYWDDFCRDILGKRIHHGPTKGGKSEKTKYDDLYGKTKAFYQEIFGESPAADLWPSNEIRFGKINYQRISTDDNWIIRKPKITQNEFIKSITTRRNLAAAKRK